MWSSYEISLWDNQDRFIETLVSSQKSYVKEGHSPSLTKNTNGEVKLNFTIPIIYYDKESKSFINNELWYNKLKQQGILANEKRVKLIFDKNKKIDGKFVHQIVETVITSVQESRSGRELNCNVQCSGLAFKWLGRIGYNIVVDSQTILLEEEEQETTIIPTINYWLNKVFPKDQSGEWKTTWSYEIAMNHEGDTRKASNKIYQKDSIVSWEQDQSGQVKPIYNQQPVEKARFMEIAQSNKYNITQDIAQTFQVFCRYQFLYEDKLNPFKITGGKVVYYDSYAQDTNYTITYGDNENSLTKTSNSQQLATKVYVEDIQNQNTNTGYTSITNAANNLSKENFILNFNYYIDSGQLSDTQQNAIYTYQIQMRNYNVSLKDMQSKRDNVSNKIVDAQIEISNLENQVQAAQDNINNYTDKINTIGGGLSATKLHDDKIALIAREKQGIVYVTFSRSGVIPGTVVCNSGQSFQLNIDQYGYAISANVASNAGTILRFSYDYQLLAFYNNQLATYQSIYDSCYKKLSQKKSQLGNRTTETSKQDGTLYEQYNFYKNQVQSISESKEAATLAFDNLMGFYLKQGKWVPDNFKAPNEKKTIENAALQYSSQALEGQPKSYYYVGAQQTKTYYAYLPLTSDLTARNIQRVVITDEWTIPQTSQKLTKSYLYNAQYTPQFMSINNQTTPILLFSQGVEKVSGHTYTFKEMSQDGNKVVFSKNVTSTFVNQGTSGNDLLYRRYKIANDLDAISSTVKLVFGNNQLEENYDYTVTTDQQGYTIITFKTNSKIGFQAKQVSLSYQSDRSSSQLYYDALDVAENSAYPIVSYDVQFSYLQKILNKRIVPKIKAPSIFDIKLNDQIELDIGMVVRINDYQLQLKGTKGIVNSITIMLDSPQQSSFTVQNYKTRFEDLFGRMVASSEQIKSRGSAYERAASAILPNLQIDGNILQNTINNNHLVISSGYTSGVQFTDQGILVQNQAAYTNGVRGRVLIKGGGIFLSQIVDADGNYIYSTGITPSGINASAINSGRLNTEKIFIYSGDQVRFAWKADGLFAYDQQESGETNYQKFVRLNEDGLLYSQNGARIVDLGWNGLYIGAQDGSLQISGSSGLTIYNGPKQTEDDNPTKRLTLGRVREGGIDYYGLRLYDNQENETLITNDQGYLWLKKQLLVGSDNSRVGLSGDGVGTPDSSPIRIWAGDQNKENAPFYVRQDGTLRASKAIITGQIYATSGTFTGKIISSQGEIGGWTINEDSISSGNMILSSKPGKTQQRINVNNKFIVTNDGKLVAKQVDIAGTITATGGKIGNLTITEINDIAGDTSIVTVIVESSKGGIGKYQEEFETVFSVRAQKGNIPFQEEDYAKYTLQWQTSLDGSQWTDIEGENGRTYNFSGILPPETYVRCKFIAIQG